MAGGEAGVTNTGMFWAMTIKLPPKALLFKHKTRSICGPVYKTNKLAHAPFQKSCSSYENKCMLLSERG